MRVLSTKSEQEVADCANSLRNRLAECFGISEPEHVIFTNGVTTSLRLIFAGLNVRKLILGPEEYCSPIHFFPLDVTVADEHDLLAAVQSSNAQAIILSTVAWTGRSFNVSEVFYGLRKALGPKCPILVADYSHAGAAGFPAIETLNADLVVGDLQKWLLPNGVADELCFAYPCSSFLHYACEKVFTGCFLATESTIPNMVRWISPTQITLATKWATRVNVTKAFLAERHRDNEKLRERLLSEMNCVDSGTLIVWMQSGTAVPQWLNDDLVWKTGSGVRIMCRADVQKLKKKSTRKDAQELP
jgi:hypothetical protein